MNLVRTSIAVASVCAVLGYNAESFAQSTSDTDTSTKDTKKATKTTKKTTKTTKKTDTSGSSTSGASDSSATGSSTTGTSGSSTSGTTGVAPASPPSPSPSDTGTTGTGTTGTGTTGSGMSGGTGIPSGSDTSGTMGTGTTGTTPFDSSGSVYPLGTQPNTQPQGTYGTQGAYGQPATAPTTQTSTTQTTSAMYDTSVTADRAEEYKVRPNRPLLVTGSAIFLGSYAATAIQGAVSPLDADRKNLIPVAGPWINMSERPCNLGDNCSTGENINNVLLIGSGVAQGAGIAIALISLAVPETHERVLSTAKAPAPKSEWRVVPGQMGRGGAGAFAVGTF